MTDDPYKLLELGREIAAVRGLLKNAEAQIDEVIKIAESMRDQRDEARREMHAFNRAADEAEIETNAALAQVARLKAFIDLVVPVHTAVRRACPDCGSAVLIEQQPDHATGENATPPCLRCDYIALLENDR